MHSGLRDFPHADGIRSGIAAPLDLVLKFDDFYAVLLYIFASIDAPSRLVWIRVSCASIDTRSSRASLTLLSFNNNECLEHSSDYGKL